MQEIKWHENSEKNDENVLTQLQVTWNDMSWHWRETNDTAQNDEEWNDTSWKIGMPV